MLVQLENHRINTESIPYFIGEIGLNHNGDYDLACRIVDALAETGAQAAKFQLFDSKCFIHSKATLGDQPPGSLQEFFQQFELKESQWRNLADHVRSCGMDFLCSVFDKPSVQLYAELQKTAVKISSCDINNHILIQDVANQVSDVAWLVSTGTADQAEVDQLVKDLHAVTNTTPGKLPLVLMQCVSAYPANPTDYNLNVLNVWQNSYGCAVGISDHCEENHISLAAVALGACVVEKHFTLDRNLPGPDQSLSQEPIAFAKLIQQAGEIQRARGSGIKLRLKAEEGPYLFGRRSLVAARDLNEGQTLSLADIEAMRPGQLGAPVEALPDLVGQQLQQGMHREDPFLGS